MNTPPKTRGEIVAEARRILTEISQIFVDAAHWNLSVRKPSEATIDPDPAGELARIRERIQSMLANEERIARDVAAGAQTFATLEEGTCFALTRGAEPCYRKEAPSMYSVRDSSLMPWPDKRQGALVFPTSAPSSGAASPLPKENHG